MNINRHNYEEFFLLYVDNELSAQEKNAVELFLQNNPDLQEELSMLQQSVIKPDAVVFENKHSLFRSETLPEELQHKLLLHLDDELNETESLAVEKLIETEAAVKAEWDILTQTKVTADTSIIFDDKQSLYRKEGGKVIAIRWWRMAAAAIFIGVGLWGGIGYFINTKKIPQENYAVKQQIKSNKVPVENIKPAEQKSADLSDDKLPVVANNNKPADNHPAEKILQPVNKKTQQKQVVEKEENTVAAGDGKDKKPSNNLPQPSSENINTIKSNNKDVADVKQENNIVSPVGKTDVNKIIAKENVVVPSPNEYAVQTSLNDKRNEDKDQAFSDEDESRKGRSKLGGFFKKLKRVIERKTNTANSENDIKIANLSFAFQ